MQPSEGRVNTATTRAERDAIFKFRYETYLLEQGKQSPDADHRRRLLTDAFDDDATLLYIERDGEIAGTVRLNRWPETSVPSAWRAWYGLDRFGDYPQSSWTFCTYFIVAQRLRGTTVMPRLFSAAFQIGVELGTRFSFCLAAPHLVGIYSQLGYRRYKSNVVTEDTGFRVPMVLLTEDVAYLEAIRSPCARSARRLTHSTATADWFARRFPQQLGTYYERQTAQHRENLASLCRLEETSLFADLDQEQREILLGESTVLRCSSGDRVLRRGDYGGEIFLILEGMAVRRAGSPQYLQAGDFCGEIAFLTETLRNDEVEAVTPLTMLVFTRSQLLRLMKRDPTAAATVSANIARQIAHRLRREGEAASPERQRQTREEPATAVSA